MEKPKIFFMTFWMTAVVLLVEGGGTLLIGLQSLWLPLVAFSMPILWILWLCCFFRKTKGDFWRLIFLWVLIDIAALSVVMTADAFLGRTGRNDADYLFVIVFSPVIFPFFLIARNFPSLIGNIISFLESITGLTILTLFKHFATKLGVPFDSCGNFSFLVSGGDLSSRVFTR